MELITAIGKTLALMLVMSIIVGAFAGLMWLNHAGYYWTVGIILFSMAFTMGMSIFYRSK